jgi:hypothetical protein
VLRFEHSRAQLGRDLREKHRWMQFLRTNFMSRQTSFLPNNGSAFEAGRGATDPIAVEREIGEGKDPS